MAFEFTFAGITISSGKKKIEAKEEPKVEPTSIKVVSEPAAITNEQLSNELQILKDEFERIDKQLADKPGIITAVAPPITPDLFPIVSPGRVSQYEGDRNFIPGLNQPVPSPFNFEVLNTLKKLTVTNRHLAQAVDNIMTLGNTDCQVKFDESIGEKQATEMQKYLWEAEENWYEYSAGQDSLDNDLLHQAATYGTMSAEAVIARDMKSIKSIVMVDPFNVRFAYDREQAKHVPLQVAYNQFGPNYKPGKYNGFVELNPNTYKYIGMYRVGEIPYAIPPFVAALDDIATQNEMVLNLKNMMRRLGMLGFLSVLVTAPTANSNESPEGYRNRVRAYLEDLKPSLENGLDRGMAIGIKGQAEFEVAGADMNTTNAEKLMQIVNNLIFSGVKQDPNMNGYNYSTTETFGRVIMQKMTNQVINYQKTLGRFRAQIYKLQLILAGYKVKQVEVIYNAPSTDDQSYSQDVEKKKFDNQTSLYDAGIIDQDKRAKNLGHDKAAQPEPRMNHDQKIKEKALTQKAAVPKKKAKKKNAQYSLEKIQRLQKKNRV